ncbi:MAG TPA: hypothetical protein VI197_28660 [Polyangiaceae bacterium]
MDLVDRIETTRFLGNEFLLWLWFAGDVTGGRHDLGERGEIEVSLESQLKLTDPLSARESISMRGEDPFGSPEADQALKQGKLPAKVLFRLKQGETEWIASLDGPQLALSGIKLPALLDEAADDPLFERLRLLEQLDDLLHELYRQFLNVRLSAHWKGELLPAMKNWVAGSVTLDQAAWTRLHPGSGKRRARRR